MFAVFAEQEKRIAGFDLSDDGARALEAHPVIETVIETPTGEEAQVDYGEGPVVRDPMTGPPGGRSLTSLRAQGARRAACRAPAPRSTTRTNASPAVR